MAFFVLSDGLLTFSSTFWTKCSLKMFYLLRVISVCPAPSVSTSTWAHLGLLEVQVLADGGEQPAQALQGLLVVVLEQLDHAVVHDGLRQHLELEQLADELDVADGAPPGLVLGLLQLLLQPVALRRLARRENKA